MLRVGTKIDVPGFGFQNPETGSVEGLEVDVARELAARLKGDANALEIVGVNVTTRGAMLDNGTLDATLATFTITDARKKTYGFSRPYYIDHIGVLVLKKSGITDLSGLDGKTVGVALSATTKDKLGAAAAEAGITEVRRVRHLSRDQDRARGGRVDAFSVDSSILLGYQDDTTYFADAVRAPGVRRGHEEGQRIFQAHRRRHRGLGGGRRHAASAEGALGPVAGSPRPMKPSRAPGGTGLGARSADDGELVGTEAPADEVDASGQGALRARAAAGAAGASGAEGARPDDGDIRALEALRRDGPDILAAFGMTAAISALALVIAPVLGFVFGVFAVSRFRILRALTRVYVETVQNIPLLLQVFVLYAVFPLIGLTIASFWIGVIAIGAYHGGYMSEVVRSGIGLVHRGQFEVAKSQGFSPVQTMTLIILPQAMRIILPPLAVQAANLVKNTSVLALIAGGELMYFANSFAGTRANTGRPTWPPPCCTSPSVTGRAVPYLEHRMAPTATWPPVTPPRRLRPTL